MAQTAKPAVERVHPPDWLMTLVNPVMKFFIRRGAPQQIAEHLLILHYRGRRSGKQYDVPAGMRRIGGRMTVLTNSGWRLNFRGGQDLEVTYKGERRPARASITEDPDEVASLYERLIDEIGLEEAGRQLGIRINVDRKPTHEELRSMIERVSLSAVWIDFADDQVP